ncbi:MAG TPA: DcaP family trimeric outer membrane transporter [Casimicrobiaceae bacterium]|nr:DcaP family trimeric outer membrane transporter [Casimicrobiaceae bacterium]
MESTRVFRAKTLALAIAVGLGSLSTAAGADTLEELKAKIDALQKKVAELEQKQDKTGQMQAPAGADNVVTGGATKGSFKLPGSNTSITLGGYVKLDAVFSNPSAGVDTKGDLFLDPTAIAVGPNAANNERNQVKFGARESRLFLKTNAPTSAGDLNTHLEVDFYGADGNESVSNSHGLRLRHAYGTLGNFLAGQTWTNFMNPAALPDTVDFGGPVGQIFDRQAQVRWTQSFGSIASGGGQWSAGLENPETVLQIPGGASFRADDDRFPDVTGQVLFNTPAGKMSVHGLLRQIRIDSATAPTAVGQKFGGALSVAGVLPTIGKDDFRFTASAGNAIGRYSNGFFPDGVLGSDAQIRLPRQWAWFGAYRHYWSDQLRSSLVLSSADETNPAGSPPNTNKSTHSAHVNLIWTPVAGSDLGVEYIYADRETEDGLKGHLNRLQAAAKYAF